MTYIVVETFNDNIALAIKDREVFQTEDLEEALKVKKELQDGLVIPLCDIVGLARSIVTNPEELNASVEIRHEMKQILGLKPGQKL